MKNCSDLSSWSSRRKKKESRTKAKISLKNLRKTWPDQHLWNFSRLIRLCYMLEKWKRSWMLTVAFLWLKFRRIRTASGIVRYVVLFPLIKQKDKQKKKLLIHQQSQNLIRFTQKFLWVTIPKALIHRLGKEKWLIKRL